MIKKSLILFVLLSVIASGLNYIIYPLFSRILGPGEYVNITVALSLFTQVSTFLSSILAITIGLSKDSNADKSQKTVELLQAFLFKLFLILAAGFLILSPLIMNSIHTPILFVIPIVLMMLLSIPVLIVSGYLNGKNQIVKLGIVTLISAVSQFAIGLTTSIFTQNGLLTMCSMVVAQFITISLVYAIFSKERLPSIAKALRTPFRAMRTKEMKSLLLYTTATALAVMAISIVQVMDLFISQNLKHTDVKFYADIYVISRIVFFAGMIFIWPFLGEVSTYSDALNRKPFYKLIGFFAAITLSTGLVLYFFGDIFTNLLFGINYDLSSIQTVGLLSVMYKFFLLVVTAVILYFVVLRSFKAIWIALATTITVYLFTLLFDRQAGMTSALLGLNIIAAISAATASVMLLMHRFPKKT